MKITKRMNVINDAHGADGPVDDTVQCVSIHQIPQLHMEVVVSSNQQSG